MLFILQEPKGFPKGIRAVNINIPKSLILGLLFNTQVWFLPFWKWHKAANKCYNILQGPKGSPKGVRAEYIQIYLNL